MGLLDRLLDASVYFSFDRSGFLRHQRRFDPADLAVDLGGRRYAVTGGNSGLGLALSEGLLRRGATVSLLCRSARRGAEAAARLADATGAPEPTVIPCDLEDFDSVDAAAAALGDGPLHGLAHNAGLLPAERQLGPTGLEQTVAVHLAGPLRLTTRLRPALRAADGARMVWVSSGGMYTQRLDLAALQRTEGPYDGVAAYARTKRAQVVLAEALATRLAGEVAVHAMHPGWATTPGVERSLPRFHRFTEGRLRSPAEGADTALWLLVAPQLPQTTGGFWFDRALAPTEPLPRTATRPADRAALLPLIARLAGVADAWP